jgi:tRNA(Ile)-lysidine synthase
MTSERESKQSPEEFWRINRYEFFDSIDVTLGPIVTAHHLDDSVETYLFSSLHGTPKVIPTHRNRVIRPFLTTPKMEFVEWCVRHTVAWADDTSNTDPKYMRNYIRHQLMPHALKVNPGLPKLVSKITEKRLHDCLDKMTDDSVELNF